jgi:hypothetical protein
MALPAPAVYWALDEGTGTTIADSAAGGGNPLTRTNGTWTTGKFSSGLANASSSHAATRSPGFDMGAQYTVGCWIRGWDGSNDGVVIGGAAGKYVAYLDATDWYYSATNFVSIAHGGGLSDGAWHHLALVRDGVNVWFYKDGTLLCTRTHGSFAADSIYSALLAYADGTVPFIASIDDVRFYYAVLTGAQVAELYALNPGGGAPPATFPGLFLGV